MTRTIDHRDRLRPIPRCAVCGGRFTVCGHRTSRDGSVVIALDCICGNSIRIVCDLRGATHAR